MLNLISFTQISHMGITAKVEPGTVQENRVAEVMKRHFKREPGVADKRTDEEAPKKVNFIINQPYVMN